MNSVHKIFGLIILHYQLSSKNLSVRHEAKSFKN